MNATSKRPSTDELAELEAYLAARQRGEEPAAGEAGFPTGLAGELLELAQQTHPDAAFAARLEGRLRRAAAAAPRKQAESSLSGSLQALWQNLTQPERKTAMKRLIAFTLAGMLLVAILFISLQLFVIQSAPPELALVTPATQTAAPASITPGAETPASATPEAAPILPEVAANFTPQPVPAQPPALPALAQSSALGYGGSGGGSLPEGIPVSLATELPSGPAHTTPPAGSGSPVIPGTTPPISPCPPERRCMPPPLARSSRASIQKAGW